VPWEIIREGDIATALKAAGDAKGATASASGEQTPLLSDEQGFGEPMRQQQQRCFYCNGPATLLCDFWLGRPSGGHATDRNGEYTVPKLAAPYTCDMPICREHAELRGNIHIKAKGRLGGFDTFDFCPEHRGGDDRKTELIGEGEAERLRRAVRANARRRLMRESGVIRSPLGKSTQGELF
jgi:hypothetical protein